MHFCKFAAAAAALLPALSSAWYIPPNGTTWQIILSEVLKPASLPKVTAIDGDLFDNKDVWSQIKTRKYKTICYFSTQYEEWRPDAAQWRATGQLGNNLDGWEGERWVNVKAQSIKKLIVARLKLAKQYKCDAVDPDNVDFYLHDTGFGLTKEDSVAFLRWLAGEAHKLDLGIGLKNGAEIVSRVIDVFDFQVNEQCQQYSTSSYNECAYYQPFIKAKKAVFAIEYNEKTPTTAQKKAICGNKRASGFSTLVKALSLGTSPTTYCLPMNA